MIRPSTYSMPMVQALCVCLCAAMLTLTAPNAQAGRLLSTSNETKSTDIAAFTKWTKLLARQPAHLKKLANKCAGDSACKKKHWEDALDEMRGKSRSEQIKAVNSYMNQTPYIQDIVNWGVEDYWATLFEFFTRNGDCEDYAIAKYLSLKKLGFDEDDLRIVILQDHNLGVIHAVLAVYEGGHRYILDNQIKTVLKDTRIHHYQPIYSINQQAWWRHLP